MTPQQQIQLGCKHIVEQTMRLRGWVDANAGDLQSLSTGLTSELSDIERRAGDISRSSLTEPAFAIVGRPEQSRRELISAVAGHAGRQLLVESSDGKIRTDLDSLLPPAHMMAATVRISGRAGRQTRAGLAFPAQLIDRIDIVKILARTFMMGPPPTRDARRHIKALQQTIDDAQQGLSAYHVPGFSATDIHDLIEYLYALCPNAVAIRNLTAAGYWDALLELLPHLEDRNRIPLLAELWGSNETMTRIYLKCSAAIQQLGNGLSLVLGHDALFAPNNSIEQNRVHPRSVLDRRTLEGILDPIADMIDVSAAYGAPQRISRSVLSLLLRDIRLDRTEGQRSAADVSDTLLFPHPGTIPGKMLCAPVVRAVEHDANLALMQLIGHVKARHLFEQAVCRHEINSLVVCCATTDPNIDDCLSEPVADWIDYTQGAEAHVREQGRTSLYVATVQSGMNDASAVASRWQAEVAANQDWPLNWYPGRPFDNLIALAHSDEGCGAVASAGNTIDASGPLPARPYRDYRFDYPRPMPSQFAAAASGSAQGALKARQLQRNLSDIRRRLRSRLLRFVVSDPQNVPEWRRQMANVSQSRLVLCAQHKRLGAMLQSLTPREQDLELILATALNKRAAANSGTAAFEIDDASNWQAAPDGERLYDSDFALDLASIVVNWWVVGMRRATRSHAFARRIRLPAQVLSQVVDELLIASERIGLCAHLTSRIQVIASLRPTQPELALRVAAQSSRFIAVFLETLQAPEPLVDAAQRVLCSASHSFERAVGDHEQSRDAAVTSASLCDRWPKAFSMLVEDNLASVQSVARGGERERALHQLLNELNASAIEADL